MSNISITKPDGTTVIPNPFLGPLFSYLGYHHPEWKYEGTGYGDGRFRVKLNDEQLGIIGCEAANSGGLQYTIHNNRIAKKRDRGDTAKTKSLDTAVKIIEKNFFKMNDTERLKVLEQEVTNKIQYHHTFARNTYNSAEHQVMQIALNYVKDHWAEMKLKLQLVEALDLLRLQQERKQVAKDATNGILVMQNGDEYIVKPKGTEDITIYTVDTLPADMKMKIGLLKLQPDDNYTPLIGLRMSATSFYIVKGEESAEVENQV